MEAINEALTFITDNWLIISTIGGPVFSWLFSQIADKRRNYIGALIANIGKLITWAGHQMDTNDGNDDKINVKKVLKRLQGKTG